MAAQTNDTASDRDLLAEALEEANLPTVLMVLVQLTGDDRWLHPPYRPMPMRGMADPEDGGLPAEVAAEVRAAAHEAIAAHLAGRPPAVARPSDEELVRMLSIGVGQELPTEFGPMIAHQVGLPAEETGPVDDGPFEVPDGFSVLVVGAGACGLCAGVQLQRAGIPFTILEAGDEVGGVWRDNRYPGAGVDTPNHLYSFSFAPNDWSMWFALRDELKGYLDGIADRFDLRPSIRFGTTVETLRWDDHAQRWDVEVRRPDGAAETLRAPVVISATGIFNPPVLPDIPGLDRFEGPAFHSATWPDDIDLHGRSVAIIGNGASCMQIGPEIQPIVDRLTVFQRSPQWASPFPQFRQRIPDALRFLLREEPLYRGWYRARLGYMFNDRAFDTLVKDPDWPHPERAMNARNDAHRRFLTEYIRSELGDRTDLLDQVLPDYPVFGKRMLLDNGWFRMLTEPNVELVTEKIEEIAPNGVITADGTLHPADVLVLATGFDVQRWLSTYEAVGRSGRTLRDRWGDDDPRAYLGTVVPDFPNFFVLYGPNLQTGHGGSLFFSAEAQMHYVMDALRQMLERDLGAIEVDAGVHDAYNAEVDAAHEDLVWTHPGMTTYYRNSAGRVPVNLPRRNVEFFHDTRHADLERDFVVTPRS